MSISNWFKRLWTMIRSAINWILCKFGWHYWVPDTMSLEAYAQKFWWCKHCKIIHFDPDRT